MDPDSRRRPRAEAAAGAHRTSVDVMVDDAGWRRALPGVQALAARAARTAGAGGTVVLSSDRTVRRLNGRHRRQDKPTNVLTFETGVFGQGDIVLALGVVRREARAGHRRLRDHLLHLVVHGALHLRGHDHHHPGDARRMEMEEARLLHRLRVPNPWRIRPRSSAS